MTALYFVLLLVSAVLFTLAAFGVVRAKVDLIALGLLCWVAVPLLQTLQRL